MPSPFEHFASLQSSFSCHLSSTNIAVFPAKSLEDFFFLKFQDSSASTFRSTKGGLGSNRTGQVGRLYLWDFGVKKKAPQAVSSLPAIKESMELNVLNRVVFQGKEGAKGIPNSEILEAKKLLEDSEAHN